MVKVRHDWARRQRAYLVDRVEHSNERVQSAIESIEAELTTPSDVQLGVFRHRLASISIASGVNSIATLSQSRDNGWQLLNRSLQFNLASFRIAAAMGFPRSSWCDANHACLLLATAISLQSRPVATWLAKLITDSYATGGPLREWDVSPFEPLMVRLAGGVEGGKPLRVESAETLPDFYDALLEAESADDAQGIIDRLVVQRVRLVSPSFSDYPPFEWSPFDLFPVDLLAILMVNHDGIPRFDFGPLESPLCDPPIPFPFEPDPLVQRVLARVAEKYDLAGASW